MTVKQTGTNLIKFISSAVSPYHSVSAGQKLLEEKNFEQLSMKGTWSLEAGHSYFVIPFPTCLFAFTIGSNTGDLHIAAAHTDFPCLHLKPKCELPARGYLRVNTEIYGGPILNTWLDRPLSLAGRVSLRSSDVYKPETRLIDFAKPLLTIPNLAVHYNREVNKGVELSKQNDMLPLLGIMNDKLNEKDYFIDLLSSKLKCEKADILDFDLYVYNYEQGTIIGINDEFISSPRLDNQTSCYALLRAVTADDAANRAGINMIALYDNEEIGSGTKQGADSSLLPRLLEKIYYSLGRDRSSLNDYIADGFLLSVDVAHALHPAHADKYDPVNCMLMNEGVTFKLSANQRYTYDTEAVAILQQLCDKYKVRYKKFVNNSNMPGGTTLGPMISSWLPMKTVDIGVPLLAMHSARELMGIDDQLELEKLVEAFFTE